MNQPYFESIFNHTVDLVEAAQEEFEDDRESESIIDAADGIVASLNYFLTTRDDPKAVLEDIIERLTECVEQELADRRMELN